MQRTMMRSARGVVAVATAALTLAACNDLTVQDLNNSSLHDLENNPTPAGVIAAAQGLFYGTRQNVGGFVLTLGSFGRESYNLQPTEPRTVTGVLIGPLDPGSTGGSLFAAPFADIRNVNVLLHATDQVSDMTDAEKEGVRGFAQTIEAIDLMQLIATRDTFGLPLDVDQDPNAPPAPIADKATVYAHIGNLLDSAVMHLQNAGSAFPFQMTAGFADFSTPATFIKFNRAIKARFDLWDKDWTGALAALDGSFIDTTALDSAKLYRGAYYDYSSNSGDVQNPLFDFSHYFAHPSIVTDAQLRPNDSLDLRVGRKIKTVEPVSVQGITTDVQFTMYSSFDDPIPLIRNEELILLRAEANLGAGSIGDALTDINTIRVHSGGLAPIDPGTWSAMTDAERLGELLYEKRYSLLFESGERWIDLRNYGLLNTLPLALPEHKRFSAMPFPTNECLARNPQPAGCSPVQGF